METASIAQLKKVIQNLPPAELTQLCLQLAKFKKENKELLSYLVFEAGNEDLFIKHVKEEMDILFSELNTTSYFFLKKGIRKILRNIKKYIRFSKLKPTEVELLLYFCKKLKAQKPSIKHNTVLQNMFDAQLKLLLKAISTLHEDLQFDYQEDVDELTSF